MRLPFIVENFVESMKQGVFNEFGRAMSTVMRLELIKRGKFELVNGLS